MSDKRNVVIVGAGVIGLTTAYTLSKNNPSLSITLISKHMPGDYDIEYASPWAGANYLPVGAPGSLLQKMERLTWPELDRLCRTVPEAGIHFQDTIVTGRSKDACTATGQWFKELCKEDAWFKDVVPDFKVLDRKELPEGCDTGTKFTSVCINTAIYLSWLVGQSRKQGVTVKRAIIKHIDEAAAYHTSGNADIVINCTALGAAKLGGVEDKNVYPGRGQIVLVRNTPGAMYTTSGTDDGPDEAMYIMQRAAGGGTILGGCLQHGASESQPDPNMAERIMQRAVEACPALVPKTGKVTELSVIRHAVGLRPMRNGGPRVEKEKINGKWVIHQYGHAGYGYQSSWGSAFETERLVNEVLKEKARL